MQDKFAYGSVQHAAYSAAEKYKDVPIGGEHPKNPGFIRVAPPEGQEDIVCWKDPKQAKTEPEIAVKGRRNLFGVCGRIGSTMI